MATKNQAIANETASDRQYTYSSWLLNQFAHLPDGMRLAEFPAHWKGIDCWCRPRVVTLIGITLVRHKDLSKGEFDA